MTVDPPVPVNALPRRTMHSSRRTWWLVALFMMAAGRWARAQDSSKVEVDIEGLEPPLERNVMAVMRLARAADQGPVPRAELKRLYQRGESDIRLALEPFGYYQPVVQSTLLEADGVVRAHFVVDAGPEVRFDKIRLEVTGRLWQAP